MEGRRKNCVGETLVTLSSLTVHCFPVHALHSRKIQELLFHFRERQFVYPQIVNNHGHLAVIVKGCSVMTANCVFQLCI